MLAGNVQVLAAKAGWTVVAAAATDAWRGVLQGVNHP